MAAILFGESWFRVLRCESSNTLEAVTSLHKNGSLPALVNKNRNVPALSRSGLYPHPRIIKKMGITESSKNKNALMASGAQKNIQDRVSVAPISPRGVSENQLVAGAKASPANKIKSSI